MIYYILLIHWIADFIVQTNWQASNKYKEFLALAQHIVGYCLCLFLAFTPYGGIWGSLRYALFNSIVHMAIDFGTSKLTHFLYVRNDNHWFFVVIGFDQLLHTSLLIFSFYWLLAH